MRTRFVLITASLCLAAGPATRPSVDQRVDQLLAPLSPVPRPPVTHAPPAKVQVVREGTTVTDETGTLGHTPDRHAVLTFASGPAMVLLPDLELDAMERRQATLGGGPTTFRVSGVTTEYKGRTYLRVTSSTDMTVADVGGRAPPRPAGRAVDRSGGPAAVAPAAPTMLLVREGTHVTDQTGRVNHSPDGQVATFTFDADGKTMRDPPMVLLPNLKLAFMEGQQLGLNHDVKFRVSGTVTEYQGRNYLLLDKVIYVQDFDADF